MERTNRGFAKKSAHRDRLHAIEANRGGGSDSLNPASRQVNRSLRAAEFDQFARTIQRKLNPWGPLEDLVTRQAIRSAWRLKTTLDAADPLDPTEPSPAADRAARSLEVAITTLDLLQDHRGDEAAPTGADSLDDEPIPLESNEWPIVPDGDDELFAVIEIPADEAPIWRDRLVYDFDVSDLSPVIRGTWITVSHVVSLIIDGATWADILRTHPELVEADIRLCVAYAVAEENSVL